MTTQEVSCAVGSVARRFADEGHVRDEAETVHFRNRDLDVELGRWKTADPLGYVDGMSRYEFVGSSPETFSDPAGLQATRATSKETPSAFNIPQADLVCTLYGKDDDKGKHLSRQLELFKGKVVPNVASLKELLAAVKAAADEKKRASPQGSGKITLVLVGHGNASDGPLMGADNAPIFGREWSDIVLFEDNGRKRVNDPEKALADLQKAAPEFFGLAGLVDELIITGCDVASEPTGQSLLDALKSALKLNEMYAFKKETEQYVNATGLWISPNVPPNERATLQPDKFQYRAGTPRAK